MKKPKQSSTPKERAPEISSINTPPLTNMDSDDDFMSDVSSQEERFEDSPESEVGSFDGGTIILSKRLWLL